VVAQLADLRDARGYARAWALGATAPLAAMEVADQTFISNNHRLIYAKKPQAHTEAQGKYTDPGTGRLDAVGNRRSRSLVHPARMGAKLGAHFYFFRL
jgi:hypothetical protein